jgi:hypothetical protein
MCYFFRLFWGIKACSNKRGNFWVPSFSASLAHFGYKNKDIFQIIHFLFKELQTGALLSLLKGGRMRGMRAPFHGVAGKDRVILR